MWNHLSCTLQLSSFSNKRLGLPSFERLIYEPKVTSHEGKPSCACIIPSLRQGSNNALFLDTIHQCVRSFPLVQFNFFLHPSRFGYAWWIFHLLSS
jgi:hypothetical protein